jgi:two-component system chemotaxis sensor kinase CheA
MGDGRIALILDVGNLSRMAKLTTVDRSERAAQVAKVAADEVKASNERQSFLIFRSSEREQFAVDLSQVERIEKIKSSQVEDLGGKRVMQYRHGSLPLICIHDVALVEPLSEHDDLLVIVFNCHATAVGLLAIGPIDALDVNGAIDETTLRQVGIKGSAIINGDTTMVLNVPELIGSIFS